MITHTAKILIFCLLSLKAFSADLPKLTKLFKQNFDNYYTPRFCGKNTRLLIEEAQKLNIDLSNSYVLKIVGGGFLETSGFYTRTTPDERVMLGYFHIVFVADDKIFDFDLNSPLVLDKSDYIRLQFTPQMDDYRVFGINYLQKSHPANWDVTFFNTQDYSLGIETKLKKLKIKQYINTSKMMKTKRKKLKRKAQ